MTKDARAVAARVLVQVVDEGRSLTDVLSECLKTIQDARQRALIQEISYGTLRWYYRLDGMLGQLLRKPLKKKDVDIYCLLLTGLYQLDQLAMPQRVAVNETVQATRSLNKQWASGLANAVLRGYQRQSADLQAAMAQDETVTYAHPAWMIAVLKADWPDNWQDIVAANNTRPPFSLRVNRQRLSRDEYLERLSEQQLAAKPLEFLSHGILLEKPVPVELLPGFSDGYVAVQDGAAQLVPGLLALAPGQRVLDACAAPGGKTAHILETGVELAGLTAVDIDGRRLDRVAENLLRLGLQAELVQGDASDPGQWWDGLPFDRILLDAPCSATGVIRRHPDIKLLRKPADITSLASRQAQLLQTLWPLLTPGGMLLYCTCSVLQEENGGQIEHFLMTQPDAVESVIDAGWGRACRHGRQLLPGENDMDGFYFACLRKAE
jgi:16S rRNA (cytosine967-C5)-methyltransferase